MKILVVVCLGIVLSGCGTGPANEGESFEEQLYGPTRRATEKIDALTKDLEGQARIDALIRALDDDLLFQAEVVFRLGEIGADAVPSLIEALSHESSLVRAGAGFVIRSIGPEAKAATPALIEALEDSDVNVRAAAADALGSIGSAAKAAGPALTEATQDEDGLVRQRAAEALKKIQPEGTGSEP